MDTTLQERLMDALHRFRKANASFPSAIGVKVTELFVLDHIARLGAEHDGHVSASDIQGRMVHFSKPALSQWLNSLEKKGYVVREIDGRDRRRIAVRLTEHGTEVRDSAWIYMQQRMNRIIERFGEEDTRRLIELLNNLSDAADQIRREDGLAEQEEDDPCEKRL